MPQVLTDEDGFKIPTNVFTNFIECPNPSCNALLLDIGKDTVCYRCGPGRIEFDAQIAEIYMNKIMKINNNQQQKKADEICKVCGRIH